MTDPKDGEDQIAEALEATFPASDPPFFVAAGAKCGTLKRKKPKGEWHREFGTSTYTAIRH